MKSIGCGKPWRLAAGVAALALPLMAGAAARDQAAASVASSAAECRNLGDFYWEIGDATGVKASGQIGSKFSANEPINVASASKFVWGAYVLEKIGRNAQPTPDQVASLQMRAGYTNLNPLLCGFTKTVDSCLRVRSNGLLDRAKIGRFAYNGGHDQKLAVDLGLGRMNAEQLSAEVQRNLGPDLNFSYASPQLAGGMESTPATYGRFLRRVVSGQLRLKQFLGYQPVCAAPGADCPNAVESPVKERWHYSLNHWVEDDPATGDGAFSSPGLMGFYPWISADKTTYGLVARKKLGATAYWDSVQCGRLIRKAWMGAKQ